MYTECAYIAQKLYPKGSVERFTILSEIAKTHTSQGNMKLGYDYFLLSYEETKRIGGNLWRSSALNNLGYYNYQINNYKKALEHYNKSIQLLDSNCEAELKFSGHVLENQAHIYYDINKDFEKSLSLYTQVSELRRNANDVDSSIESDLGILKSLAKLKRLQEFKNLESNLITYFTINRSPHQNKTDSRLSRFYIIRLAGLKQQGLYKKYINVANEYQSHLNEKFTYNDSIGRQSLERSAELQQHNYDKNVLALEQQSRNLKTINQRNVTLLILFVVVIVLFVILLIYFLKIKRIERDRLIEEAIYRKSEITHLKVEKTQLNNLLVNKRNDLRTLSTDNLMRTQSKKDLIESLESIVSKNEDVPSKIKSLILDLKSQTMTEHRVSTLSSDLSKFNTETRKNLIQKYPKLTKSEADICALILLNLSIKEISQINKTSTNSIKTARSRIRKKMNLSPDIKLDYYIQSLDF